MRVLQWSQRLSAGFAPRRPITRRRSADDRDDSNTPQYPIPTDPRHLRQGSRLVPTRSIRFEGRILRIWNHFLAANREAMQAYREGQGDKPKGGFAGSVSFYGLGKQFTALRRDTPWLHPKSPLVELSFAPVRYVLKRQAEAFKRFFDGGGYPRFKSRRGGDSVTLPDQVRIDGDPIESVLQVVGTQTRLVPVP